MQLLKFRFSVTSPPNQLTAPQRQIASFCTPKLMVRYPWLPAPNGGYLRLEIIADKIAPPATVSTR
jgi:hypothetical protein